VNEQEKSGPASGVPTIIDQYITCRLQGRQETWSPVVARTVASGNCGRWPIPGLFPVSLHVNLDPAL
jgi:hypothetical protein